VLTQNVTCKNETSHAQGKLARDSLIAYTKVKPRSGFY
jgi:hypothetical protein